MNTRVIIENSGAGTLLCTLEVPDTKGGPTYLRFTTELSKDPTRTIPQLEYQVLQRASDFLAQLCSHHPESKRT